MVENYNIVILGLETAASFLVSIGIAGRLGADVSKTHRQRGDRYPAGPGTRLFRLLGDAGEDADPRLAAKAKSAHWSRRLT